MRTILMTVEQVVKPHHAVSKTCVSHVKCCERTLLVHDMQQQDAAFCLTCHGSKHSGTAKHPESAILIGMHRLEEL